MSPTTVQQAFGRRALQKLAAGRSFERGVAYAEAGRVRNLKAGEDVVIATVRGSRAYRVRLWVGNGGPSFECDCPVGEEGSFCKHCVAVALEVAAGHGASAQDSDGRETPVTEADVRRHLEQLGTAALVTSSWHRRKTTSSCGDGCCWMRRGVTEPTFRDCGTRSRR